MSGGERSGSGDDREVIDLRAFDRRAALKRGAIVGAAAIWATPVVQTVGISRAAAQDPSTVTTTTTSTTQPPPATEICNIQIVVRHNHCYFGLLYDGRHWIQWSERAPDAIDCLRFFGDAHDVDPNWLLAVLFNIRVKVKKVSDFLWTVTLPLPKGVEFVTGWAQAGEANLTGCKKGIVAGSKIEFSASS